MIHTLLIALTITLTSPDGRISVQHDGGTWRMSVDGVTVLDGRAALADGLDIEWRVTNQGAAYRWVGSNSQEQDQCIENELAEFRFAADYTAWLPHTTNSQRPMAMAFQATYNVAPLSQARQELAFLPATVDCGHCKVTLMESDVEAYPGMFVRAQGQTLTGVFAPYPARMERWPWRQQTYVAQAEPYIYRGTLARAFPWRVMAVSHVDTDMPTNDLVWQLASPSRIADTSWIRPGKAAWEWWNDWGLTGVPFRAGINTDTYIHYIDFAARYGLEYVVIDEGWYAPKSGDMLTAVPDVDLPRLVDYAAGRGVGVILWTVFNVLDEQLDEACAKYAAMGVKGFKVDFLDRDDQTAAEMAYRIAERCAAHHLILDYHGLYKPTGLTRTWPNIVNWESVFGMEEAKWTELDSADMPLYDVTFPYIRMQCGPVDFTPGGMRNATKADFRPVYSNPMTMGTRCHQAAMYVVQDSPLTMLADSPSAYDQDPEYTAYIAQLPVTWQARTVPQGRMGEYIIMVRRSGDKWYAAGQTNWDARDVSLSLDFLGGGTWQADMLTDGANAHRIATDYARGQRTVTAADTLNIHMASGGGFVITFAQQ